jgi:glycosyltransferase involved in cell wall biosynthesis
MTETRLPTVSIVIPTFNRARYLPDALDSVFRQDVDAMQAIVIDDGSTDDTESVIAAYGRGVQYVRQKHQGAAAARNAGVALATGAFISFLDSDDVWMPGKTKAELAVFDENPGADAVISDSERWLGGKLVCSSWLADRGLVVTSEAPIPLQVPHLEKGKIFATCSLIVRRRALERLGLPLFDTSFETHEDLDFAIRMQHCCSIMVLPKTLAQVRRFDDGSRVGRPLPGTEYPPALKRTMAYRRYRIFEKALGLRGWPDAAVPYLHAGRSEAANDFANNLRGWHRDVASIVAGELRHASFGSAATIMVHALLPEKGRVLLRSLGTARGGV